jgi:hypothetical protein
LAGWRELPPFWFPSTPLLLTTAGSLYAQKLCKMPERYLVQSFNKEIFRISTDIFTEVVEKRREISDLNQLLL